jgi:hypothetical protein
MPYRSLFREDLLRRREGAVSDSLVMTATKVRCATCARRLSQHFPQMTSCILSLQCKKYGPPTRKSDRLGSLL